MISTAMTRNFDSTYWNERYQKHDTGWDLGEISPPLKAYFDQIEDKSIRILIPGAGRGYEAQYLYEQGFMDVHILDFAPAAIEAFRRMCPEFPVSQIHQKDYFQFRADRFDLIIEQTFFSSLHPTQRPKYVLKTYDLLKKKGKLTGLLFNDSFKGDGPPFGGDIHTYLRFFKELFEIKIFEPCFNSVKPRADREIFVSFQRMF